ncbi:phage tail protein [Francisella philomiragia]|uniref:Phage tail protein n=1 Tax=Francisella philomiragia TaxID=28110 RepID=A0ABS1GCV8_9GAMM|nr:phage tail protein [Francisella philomiragia]MBK2258975.1 phage tail protein [Francisella philomiragia]MBK2302666.1 phage tail protein [Francisella philomiragia]
MNITSLILGDIPLGTNTVTYNRVSKQYNNNWAKQDRINNTPALQNTGSQSETMNISGITLPSNSVTEAATLEILRELAESSSPQFLFNLDGLIHGKWVITGINKDQENGDKTTYNIDLQRYQEEDFIEQSKAYIKGLF